MTRQEWAREKVEKVSWHGFKGSAVMSKTDAVRLLKAERARARRVVRTVKKQARFIATSKRNHKYFPTAFANGYRQACDELLRRLT